MRQGFFRQDCVEEEQGSFGVSLGVGEGLFRLSHARTVLERGRYVGGSSEAEGADEGHAVDEPYIDVLPLLVASFLEPEFPDESGM
jgi:hypothetical protein